MTCADCIFCIVQEDGTTWCNIKRCEVFEPCIVVQPDDDVLGQVFDG